MWTRSKTRAAKEAPDFRTFDTPKRKTLIRSKSLNSISTLKSFTKPEPFNLHTRSTSPKMANPTQNIYPA